MHSVPPNPGGLGGITWTLSHGVHSILVPDRLAQYSSDHDPLFPDQEMSRVFWLTLFCGLSHFAF